MGIANAARRLHNELLLLDPEPCTKTHWPEHLQEVYKKRTRSRVYHFEILVLLTVSAAITSALGLQPAGLILGVHLAAMTRCIWVTFIGVKDQTFKKAFQLAKKDPGKLPAQLISDPELGYILTQHLRKLDPAEQEIVRVLLYDGYDGTMGDLIKAAQQVLA